MSCDTPLSVGLRVVRGPDWKWDDQDGGEGHAGTVVEIGGFSKAGEDKESHPPSPRGTVILQWDTGLRTNYRVGHQNAYDLRVIDSAPGSINHPNITCKTCYSSNNKLSTKAKRRASSTCTSDNSSSRVEEPNTKCDKINSSLFISGIRWSCSVCSVTSQNSYDMCTACYMSDKHNIDHAFWRIDAANKAQVGADPSSPFQVSEGTVLMKARSGSKKVALRGLFPNCKVVRGQDWNWTDQDGGQGKIGKILEIHGWDNDTERSVATVFWTATNIQNVYRLGHKGKVDIKVAPNHPAASYGTYYPDHLPVLGRSSAIAVATTLSRNVSHVDNAAFVNEFNVGDMVKIGVGLERLRCLQEGHSGFNPRMSGVISKIGKVHRVTGNGDVRVQYNVPPNGSENPANYRWTINPEALRKIDDEEFYEDNTKMEMEIGRLVKVIENEDLVRTLQPGHGEWIPRMKGVLGKTGRILKVYTDGDVRVEMIESYGLDGGKTLTFNPACLVIQQTNTNHHHQPPECVDNMRRPKNNSCGSPFPALAEVQVDSVVAEAARGDLDKLRERFLKSNSDSKVDMNVIRACLQAASQNGKTEIVSFLLNQFPEEANVRYQGKTILHVASHQGHLNVVQ